MAQNASEIEELPMSGMHAFQRDLLFIIAATGRSHGLGLKEQAEKYYGESINHGRLYPNLDELVEAGYVEKGEQDRRTNYYVLTDEGCELIKAHIDAVLALTKNARLGL